MRCPKLQFISLALAVMALAGLHHLFADSGWGPKIDRIYFTQPYSPGPNGETMMMVIEGKNFTANSKVLVDGERISSRCAPDKTLQVYIDACSAPERHSVVVEDRDGWGRTVKSKAYKAEFCLQE